MEPFASIENLEKLLVYRMARELGRLVWDAVSGWSYQAKRTIGYQWIEATDSISANIAEGYGRYYFYDCIKFYYYARGSFFESNDWFAKAVERGLLAEDVMKGYRELAVQLPKELNMLIKRTRENASKYHNNKSIN